MEVVKLSALGNTFIMVDLLSPTSMNGDSGGIWIVDITIEMNCDTAAKSRVGTLKI